MNLDVVPSGFVPLPTDFGDANAIEKVVADLIGGVRRSHSSASQAVNTLYSAGSGNDRPLAIDQGKLCSGVVGHADGAS